MAIYRYFLFVSAREEKQGGVKEVKNKWASWITLRKAGRHQPEL
jgi:hypothetical protein